MNDSRGVGVIFGPDITEVCGDPVQDNLRQCSAISTVHRWLGSAPNRNIEVRQARLYVAGI